MGVSASTDSFSYPCRERPATWPIVHSAMSVPSPLPPRRMNRASDRFERRGRGGCSAYLRDRLPGRTTGGLHRTEQDERNTEDKGGTSQMRGFGENREDNRQ